jgi:hypothetical protein
MSYPITEDLKYLAFGYEIGGDVDISADNIFQRCLDEIASLQAVLDAARALHRALAEWDEEVPIGIVALAIILGEKLRTLDGEVKHE